MKLTKLSLLVVPLFALSTVLSTSTAEAFGGYGGGMRGGFRFGHGGFGDKVNVQITKLRNGIQTTVTTDDADVLAQIHTQADRHALMQSLQHSVTNLENGVQIEITSDNPDAVAMIQSREQPKEGRGADDVVTVQENIGNGVRITITTTDPEKVERIQLMAEKGKGGHGMFGGRKGRGYGRMGSFEKRESGQTDE